MCDAVISVKLVRYDNSLTPPDAVPWTRPVSTGGHMSCGGGDKHRLKRHLLCAHCVLCAASSQHRLSTRTLRRGPAWLLGYTLGISPTPCLCLIQCSILRPSLGCLYQGCTKVPATAASLTPHFAPSATAAEKWRNSMAARQPAFHCDLPVAKPLQFPP